MGASEPLRVVALTAGRNTPSRRYRVAQHVAALAVHGIAVREHVAPIPRADPVPGRGDPATSRFRSSTSMKAGYAACKLAAQLPGVAASHRADVTWLQKELLPGYATLERLTGSPRVFDIDDAVWLIRPGSEPHIAAVVRSCDLVMAGNDYLAEWCESRGADVRVVPTAVDTDRWQPGPARSGEGFTIGWIGQHSNLGALERLEPVLTEVLADVSSTLVVCSDRRPRLTRLAPERVRFISWSERDEVAAVQAMDVGLMPLEPGAWAEGKCSMKLLQYLACGIPAVATPTGANRRAAADGRASLLATDHGQWIDAITSLREDPTGRARLGAAGRARVVENYSVTAVSSQIARTLRDAAR